jgi:hypothetical protein
VYCAPVKRKKRRKDGRKDGGKEGRKEGRKTARSEGTKRGKVWNIWEVRDNSNEGDSKIVRVLNEASRSRGMDPRIIHLGLCMWANG